MTASAALLRSRDEAQETNMENDVQGEPETPVIPLPRLAEEPLLKMLASEGTAFANAVSRLLDGNEEPNYSSFGSTP
jgi:hypothetical protein